MRRTGLTVGSLPEGRATRLLDAAHIRPVGDRGPDSVSNGVSLTPTVHGLFDEGQFRCDMRAVSLTCEIAKPRTRDDRSARTWDGNSTQDWRAIPLACESCRVAECDQVRYHQRMVFKGPESLVS